LVEGVDLSPYWPFLSSHNIVLSGSTDKDSIAEQLYILSMGHRIHFILYNSQQNEVRVFRLVSNSALSDMNELSGGVSASYKYYMFLPAMGRYQETSQRFSQYPSPEYNWNSTDAVIIEQIELDPTVG
jgi:hypothetical protein